MTDQPQYPSYPSSSGEGGQPPSYGQPPPPAYGQQPGYPPPPPGYGGQPPAYGPTYAGWGSRVGAYLLDGLIGFGVALVLLIPGYVMLFATSTTGTDIYGNSTIEDVNPLSIVLIVLGYLSVLVFSIWNFVFRQGRKGQTLGKKIVGIKVVKEQDGQVMGAGLALGRYLLNALLTSVTCYINVLWPLWDDKKQALHDKVVSTIVVSA